MANPSLQIGNNKWGIKEDNLLGYNTVGTNFLPIETTMTRASAGTRVNPQGLVETVELLGSELVTNGDFELNSDWGNFSSPTTSEQSSEQSHTGTYSWKIIADATQEGIASPNNFNLTSGLTYSVSLWIYSVSGNSIKSGLNNTNVSVFTERTVTVGEWTNITYMATASSTGASYISILSQNSLNFFVDNVSVKESTKNDLARVDYDGTASSLLVEPQRTNLIPYSSDFTVGNWAKTRCTVTSNQATSPDGTLNADLMTSTDDDARLGDQVGSSGAEFTQSIYVKSAQVSDVNCQIDFAGLNTVTFTANQQWQRVETTLTDTSQSPRLRLRILNSGNSIYVWGGQVEEGSYATSYIPTSGSTVTRVQETYEKTGISSKINSEEGVLFLEIAYLSETDPLLLRLSLSDGTTNNRIIIQTNQNSNYMQFYLINSSGVQISTFYTLPNKTNFNKIAFKWKVNDFAVWSNGVEVITDTSGTTFSAGILNRLGFDGGNGSNNFYGKVKQLQVFKTALTDSELATLTTQ